MFHVVIDGVSVKLKASTLEGAVAELKELFPAPETPEPISIFKSDSETPIARVDVAQSRRTPTKKKFNPDDFDLGGEG